MRLGGGRHGSAPAAPVVLATLALLALSQLVASLGNSLAVQGRNHQPPPQALTGEPGENGDGELRQSKQETEQRQQLEEAKEREEEEEEPIYLEGVEDLDHLSYLSLRNYNLTDEGLLQSSWLMGLGTVLGPHKLHLMDQMETAGALSLAADKRVKLPLMLESFISHLRNGHLKRMNLEDLEGAASALNLTDSFEELRQRRLATLQGGGGERANRSAATLQPTGDDARAPSANHHQLDEHEIRCLHLVTLYKFDLGERRKNQQQQQQSKVEYENAPQLANSANNATAQPGDLGAINEQQANSTSGHQEQAPGGERQAVEPSVDDMRLLKLCKLVIVCRSSDELVSLISKPWKSAAAAAAAARRKAAPTGQFDSAREASHSNGSPEALRRRRELERDSSPVLGLLGGAGSLWSSSGPGPNSAVGAGEPLAALDESRQRRKSLRDSLSLSLAKLCPLILFPLHEEDGQCSLRRDDRPPMIAVWAFATLFVTIVCFCSLIGLSITPLLGQSAADSSTVSSDASEPLAAVGAGAGGHREVAARQQQRQQRQQQRERKQQHKASLTVFEGLAVGSLVGSALFSLIPQAFELQERESNQSFLLKAFIIFSGIYLFFCSERIMRIILDTRQTRKKRKRQTIHRSSTTAAIEGLVAGTGGGGTGGGDSQQQQRQRSQSLRFGSSATTALASGSRVTSNASRQSQASSANTAPSFTRDGGGGGGGGGGGPAALDKRGRTSATSVRGKRQEGAEMAAKKGAAPERRRANQHRQRREGDVASPLEREREREHRHQLAAGARQAAAVKKQSSSKKRNRAARPASGRPVSGANQQLQQQQHLQPQPQPQAQPGRTKAARNQMDKQQRRLLNKWRQKQAPRGSKNKSVKQQAARKQRSSKASAESDLDDYYHHRASPLGSSSPSSDSSSSSSTTSTTTTTTTSSFSSYTLERLRATQDGLLARLQPTEDSQLDYSFSSSSSSSAAGSHLSRLRSSSCCSCASLGARAAELYHPHEDSDEDNNQARAVSKQMSEFSRRLAEQQQQQQSFERAGSGGGGNLSAQASQPPPPPLKTATFKFNEEDERRRLARLAERERTGSPRSRQGFERHRDRAGNKKQDISTVAWMIVLGDGLHNFIDGISIGAAFSESILSGVSISVAVICEEFPHELGDFAVLVSAGMTVRQALGYNFLSACTCYLGMAVGIILGDVTDGASYISALAAGVFLYIALVDMMGELSAALEESSRDSITRTLKLLVLQNVGIFIGISIIFVLSFIDF